MKGGRKEAGARLPRSAQQNDEMQWAQTEIQVIPNEISGKSGLV